MGSSPTPPSAGDARLCHQSHRRTSWILGPAWANAPPRAGLAGGLSAQLACCSGRAQRRHQKEPTAAANVLSSRPQKSPAALHGLLTEFSGITAREWKGQWEGPQAAGGPASRKLGCTPSLLLLAGLQEGGGAGLSDPHRARTFPLSLPSSRNPHAMPPGAGASAGHPDACLAQVRAGQVKGRWMAREACRCPESLWPTVA